jgi:predicted ribosome quality control (RQC) complex YloA/Tae2 family protein
MRTDPALIARLAGEIDERFRGAKVRDVGLLSDKRTAIVLRARGVEHALCIDVFGTPPLVTLEDRELPIAVEPGFIRAAGTALRGSTLISSKARKGDRLLRLTFGTRSRFGVGDESDLYIELVPRFGNIVLVRNDRVVAAAKEFSLAQNGTRAIEAGGLYHLPPLVAKERPPSGDAADGSVLDAMTAARAGEAAVDEARRTDDRRRVLLRRLDERERKLRGERASLDAKREQAAQRESLRAEADSIYATLHELPQAERDERKERAAKLFARYKKLGNSIAHVDERTALVDAVLASIEALRWETERAGDAELPDVQEAIAHLDPRQTRASAKPVTRRKRAPLEVRTQTGSRILIGRSPVENADLTFRVARPNDWWFHAQNIPGAHVILQRDDRSEPSEEDIERAASYAAFFSKGRTSAKVAIDYTLRKYVRAQRNAPPGLVWYTQPRTILAEPKEP